MSGTTIRVSVQRALSESEKEWIRELDSFRPGETLAFTEWNGMTYRWTRYPFYIRLSKRQKFWLHSEDVSSRRLYKLFLKFLEDNFVNLHPVAVRTMSEGSKDTGEVM